MPIKLVGGLYPPSAHNSPTFVSKRPIDAIASRSLAAVISGMVYRLIVALAPGRQKPCLREFARRLVLLSPCGERGEDAEHQLAAGRSGIDARPMAGQHFEANAAFGQLVYGVDQMPQIAAQPIELPDNKRITVTKCLSGNSRGRDDRISPARHGVLVKDAERSTPAARKASRCRSVTWLPSALLTRTYPTSIPASTP